MGRILFVINPGASGGRGQTSWERFLTSWPDAIDPVDVRVTDHPGQATDIASSADDYEILAAVGGDGSVNEILNGIMERDGRRPHVAIIPAGTGNDIARNIGLFPFEVAVSALKTRHKRSFDLIKTEGVHHGIETKRYAFLSASVGFSTVAGTRPWTKRILGPTVAYYLNTILAILAHKPPNMSIHWDDDHIDGRTWMVVVANVESSSGGSMRIAPGASPHDGLLWVTIVEAKPKLTMMFKALPKVASGDHVNEEGFHYFSTRKIEIRSDVPVVMEPDGETEWITQVTQTIVPGAVTMISPVDDC